jgi:hypothetical protein
METKKNNIQREYRQTLMHNNYDALIIHQTIVSALAMIWLIYEIYLFCINEQTLDLVLMAVGYVIICYIGIVLLYCLVKKGYHRAA